MDYILSLSYGKDSLACLGAIQGLGWPLTGSPGFATARKRWKNKMENKVKNG